MQNKQHLICARHKKYEKDLSTISNSYYICLNRYCDQRHRILCANCKLDHRDHIVKLLSIEDVCFLIDRLLKTPFKQASFYLGQTIEIMKKLQLIREFKKKIDLLEQQIEKDTISMVEITQGLISQYAACKKAANQSADLLFDVHHQQVLKQLINTELTSLAKIDYNFQKDVLEFGGKEIKEIEEQRRKVNNSLKKKIEEVKQYSMKIIEVILNTETSSEEEGEDVIIQKKIYEKLKNQLYNRHPKQSKQKDSDRTISTNANTEPPPKKDKLSAVKAEKDVDKLKIKDLQYKLTDAQSKIMELERELIADAAQAAKEKQERSKVIRQKDKTIKMYQAKIQMIRQYQLKLRESYRERTSQQHRISNVVEKVLMLLEEQSMKRNKSEDRKFQKSRNKSTKKMGKNGKN